MSGTSALKDEAFPFPYFAEVKTITYENGTWEVLLGHRRGDQTFILKDGSEEYTVRQEEKPEEKPKEIE